MHRLTDQGAGKTDVLGAEALPGDAAWHRRLTAGGRQVIPVAGSLLCHTVLSLAKQVDEDCRPEQASKLCDCMCRHQSPAICLRSA